MALRDERARASPSPYGMTMWDFLCKLMESLGYPGGVVVFFVIAMGFVFSMLSEGSRDRVFWAAVAFVSDGGRGLPAAGWYLLVALNNLAWAVAFYKMRWVYKKENWRLGQEKAELLDELIPQREKSGYQGD